MADAPQQRFLPIPCDGVLNERLTPVQVGGQGLTACENIIYHRQGGWGKRPGTTRDQIAESQGSPLNSGVRWYRVFPTRVTKLVVWTRGQLLIGDSPLSLTPVANSGDLSLSSGVAPDFCSMRDPQARQGNGADVLIIAGLTLKHGSFAKGAITLTGVPWASIDAKISITVQKGSQTVTTAPYQILPTDNPASITSELADLLNQSAAFLNQGNPPFLGESYFVSLNPRQNPPNPPQQAATLHLGARDGGADGNSIFYSVNFSGTAPPPGTVNPLSLYMGIGSGEVALGPPPVTSPVFELVGGGDDWSGPLRYDHGDGKVVGLSYMAPNAFTGCCTWHDHAWFWGDHLNPDTVFASDINQPEAFTFMEENGGMGQQTQFRKGVLNGGYNVGPGDGDPAVQCCKPNGDSLGVFKTANIYQMQGYDFQAGEYTFSLTPQVVGYGIPSRDCVDVLEGQYVFWSGRKLLRLAVGAYEPEHIGLSVPKREARAASGDQSVVKVVAGDFQVLTDLSEDFVAPGSPPQVTLLRSMALFAVDANQTGNADVVYVYDDEKTAQVGQYAWTVWTGWEVGSWIKYGAGDNPAGKQDKPLLYFVGSGGQHIYFVGNNPTLDWNDGPISWMAQTGFIDFQTPELIKQIHEFYLRVQATVGAQFSVTAIPSRIVPAPPEVTQYPMDPVTWGFGPTLAPANSEALNNLKAFIQSALQVQALAVQVREDGTSGAAFELLSYGIDANPQEGYPN